MLDYTFAILYAFHIVTSLFEIQPIWKDTIMKEFYIDGDGTRLHAKLDIPEGVTKGPLCILIHGFTGHMEEEHIIGAHHSR